MNDEETVLDELEQENEQKIGDSEINEITTEREVDRDNIDEMPIIIQSTNRINEEYIVVGPELHKISEPEKQKEKKYHINDYVVVHYNKQFPRRCD
ncbi:hypothetical protein QE152_g40050 [Popillia japonica]|uniref:Uncharacterized protein n=1 Tax=Popillia japonica TaxID=7064 RepID=A0AAW1HT13_POPJA